MNITQQQTDAIVERIRPHGHDIRIAAESGNELCKDIMSAYETLYNKPGSAALGVLQSLMDEYETSKKETTS